ncbi:MAG: flagellar basal body-associated FliL family protein [Pseudomonadota bacterium]
MADEKENPEEGEEESGGGMKKMLLFGGAIIVAIGGGIGGTLFFLGGDPEPVAETPVVEKKKTAVYHKMRPAFIINYITGAKPRFLQAEFTLMARHEDTLEAVVLHMPLIRSEVVSYLTEQNFLELQTQEGKENIRGGIVDLVNRVLTSYKVENGVESALITNFVLQ